MQRQQSQEEEEALTKISVNISQGYMGSRRNWSFRVSCKVRKREMKKCTKQMSIKWNIFKYMFIFCFEKEFLVLSFVHEFSPLGEVSPAVHQSKADCKVRWFMCLLKGCRVGHKVPILGLQLLPGSSSQGSQGMCIMKSIKAFSLVIYEM